MSDVKDVKTAECSAVSPPRVRGRERSPAQKKKTWKPLRAASEEPSRPLSGLARPFPLRCYSNSRGPRRTATWQHPSPPDPAILEQIHQYRVYLKHLQQERMDLGCIAKEVDRLLAIWFLISDDLKKSSGASFPRSFSAFVGLDSFFIERRSEYAGVSMIDAFAFLLERALFELGERPAAPLCRIIAEYGDPRGSLHEADSLATRFASNMKGWHSLQEKAQRVRCAGLSWMNSVFVDVSSPSQKRHVQFFAFQNAMKLIRAHGGRRASLLVGL